MSRTIICTCGTTIAQGCPSVASHKQRFRAWDDPLPGLADEIQQRISKFDLSDLSVPTELSAEINSLLLLGCCSEDEVIVLASDDAVGRICSEQIATTIRRTFGLQDAQCKVVRIPQLQMQDVGRFKREGLPHLVEVVLGYVRDPQRRYGGGVVLNPTGGFKGVVPFMALLGMLFGARVAYGSRASNQLVTLPPLPITQDSGVLQRAAEAIAWAERQGVFRSEEFFAKIPITDGESSEMFGGLLEVSPDGDATLSSLATVLIEKVRYESGQVLISPVAAQKLQEMTGPSKAAALAWLERAGFEDWRRGNSHKFRGSDLEVYGEKRKPIRIAGFTAGKDFYVCQFYFQDHDTYDRDLFKYQRKHFNDLEAFLPLWTDSFGPEDAVESWGDLLAERELLRAEVEKWTERANELNEQLRSRLAQARKDAHLKREELKKRIAELERELQEAKIPKLESISASKVTLDSGSSPATPSPVD